MPYYGDCENAEISSEDHDNARVMYPFRPSRGPQEGKGYVSLFDFGPYYGTLITQGFLSRYPQLWGPAKAVVSEPLLILSPFWGTPENAGVA